MKAYKRRRQRVAHTGASLGRTTIRCDSLGSRPQSELLERGGFALPRSVQTEGDHEALPPRDLHFRSHSTPLHTSAFSRCGSP